MSKDRAASVRARLLNIAKAEQMSVAAVEKQVARATLQYLRDRGLGTHYAAAKPTSAPR